jgi:cardiolipin synthase
VVGVEETGGPGEHRRDEAARRDPSAHAPTVTYPTQRARAEEAHAPRLTPACAAGDRRVHNSILTLADWFSLARIPLGALFLVVAERLPLALLVLVLAGISDVLDGWAARRQPGQDVNQPHRGDWLDPFCDKVFVAAMLAGIYVAHRPPPVLLLLVVTRELLQVLSLVVYRLWPALRRGLRYNYRAHPLGKLTTVTQFATALALLFEHPVAMPLAVASSLLGVASVAVYLNRARVLARTDAAAAGRAPP